MEIGQYVKNLRHKAGLSQKQLAMLIGRERRSIIKLENGSYKRFPYDLISIVLIELKVEKNKRSKLLQSLVQKSDTCPLCGHYHLS